MSGKSLLTRSGASSVATLGGYGVSVTVERGTLILRDGIGDQRQVRRIHRSDGTLRRLVINSSNGTMSLAALRWCADVGIAIVVLDPMNGELLALNAPAVHDDARLRRAQAVAAGTTTELQLARTLISGKVHAQAQTAKAMFGDADLVENLTVVGLEAECADDLPRLAQLEAQAAASYFSAWRGTLIRFAKADTAAVPPAWLAYEQRTSPLSAGHSPRGAIDPLNAMMNYCYRLLEVEAMLACHAMGLDPGLGLVHRDKKGRDSLALDLVEPVRPHVDAYLLDLTRRTTFTRRDFSETREGHVVVHAPLTEDLAGLMPTWARLIAPLAESVAHELAASGTGRFRVRRPLTGRPASSPRRADLAPAPTPPPRCVDCGVPLSSPRHSRCTSCNQPHVTQLPHDRAARGRQQLTSLRQSGRDPSTTTQAAAKRAASLARNRAALKAWQAANPDAGVDAAEYDREIRPRLGQVSVSVIATTLDISLSAASRIRAGSLMPHARHWPTMAGLLGPDPDA